MKESPEEMGSLQSILYLSPHCSILADIIIRVYSDPCGSRYRLLLKSDGFLISSYIPPGIKQTYGLESVPIEDSDVIVYAIYRNDPQKENLIREYIDHCMSLIR